jgi:hypothetical protein
MAKKRTGRPNFKVVVVDNGQITTTAGRFKTRRGAEKFIDRETEYGFNPAYGQETGMWLEIKRIKHKTKKSRRR